LVSDPFAADTVLDQEIAKAREAFADELCALHAATHLPIAVIYPHVSELHQLATRADFSASAFQAKALRQEQAEIANARQDQETRRRADQIQAVVAGAALFVVPLLGLYGAWLAGAWAYPRVDKFKAALSASFIGSFCCFWQANDQEPAFFASGQWQLLGLTLFLIGAATWWHRRR